MQSVTMLRAFFVEPGFVVEPDGVYHQRVAIPVAYGVSVPGRLELCGMSSLQVDRAHHAVGEIFK